MGSKAERLGRANTAILSGARAGTGRNTTINSVTGRTVNRGPEVARQIVGARNYANASLASRVGRTNPEAAERIRRAGSGRR